MKTIKSGKQNEKTFVMGAAFGAAFGAAAGSIFDSIGISYGISFGILAGVIIARFFGKELTKIFGDSDKTDTKEEK